MKLTDKIPGKQVLFNDNETVANNILLALNPNNLPPLELWNELHIINKDLAIQEIDKSQSDSFYLMYTYYFKEPSHRVFLADKEEVIKFINDVFDEEWDEGMDIVIEDLSFKTIIMGNHDGVLLKR